MLSCGYCRRAAQRPLSIARAMLTSMQGTPLHDRVVFECDSLRQFYEQVRASVTCALRSLTRALQLFPALSDAYPVHYPETQCSWDVFLWLRCLFDSRAFHLKAKDGSLMPSLLPGADMFNYRFPSFPSTLLLIRSRFALCRTAASSPMSFVPPLSDQAMQTALVMSNSPRLRAAVLANKFSTCTAVTSATRNYC
jgi:hypothetical protein